MNFTLFILVGTFNSSNSIFVIIIQFRINFIFELNFVSQYCTTCNTETYWPRNGCFLSLKIRFCSDGMNSSEFSKNRPKLKFFETALDFNPDIQDWQKRNRNADSGVVIYAIHLHVCRFMMR